MFGDDPSEGAIRGRLFIHPRLGFAFKAPEGFTLENSSQAVLGVVPSGNEVLRLDSVKLASNVTLESYLETGWIEGLIANSITQLEVNGMPALIANAHAGEWSFLVAVVRFDDSEVHRLIFATRALTDDALNRYRASIESFHHTTPEEARAVRPLRLAIVSAKPEDTSETLALKMTMPEHALEYFLLINGLDQGTRLQSGERYKIVIE
jgi:predicted Zn-dependent protease